MRRSGIDISHWEDPINFKKVAGAGIIAVIAEAGWIVLSERDAKDIRQSR